jgi:S-adenosylmethionine:tRNA ribosyltransferase-isomerase
MRLDAFDYELPEASIAQEALPDRAASRLMVVDGAAGHNPVAETTFRHLPEYLRPGDLVVVNRSRVVPARLVLTRATGGRVEALYLESDGDGAFLAWARPLGRLRPGEVLSVEGGRSRLRFEGAVDARTARFVIAGGAHSVAHLLEREGHVPLPPYIRRPDRRDDRERYQTVYAGEGGSVAAPTAGLHFDAALLDALSARNIETASIVLHVGPGTFAPLENDEVDANELHAERFSVPAETIEAVRRTRRAGGAVVAVGTTVTRALEAAHAAGWLEGPGAHREGRTNLFIRPGYTFEVVDRLVTNFHLPRSSLLMLVCAFAGRRRTLECYAHAVRSGYRFFSYGDAMLVTQRALDTDEPPAL